MAWAITQIEDHDSPEFRDEIKQHRLENWGKRPWPGTANDEQQFLRHVADMAGVFAGCDSAGGRLVARPDCSTAPRCHGSPIQGRGLVAESRRNGLRVS